MPVDISAIILYEPLSHRSNSTINLISKVSASTNNQLPRFTTPTARSKPQEINNPLIAVEVALTIIISTVITSDGGAGCGFLLFVAACEMHFKHSNKSKPLLNVSSIIKARLAFIPRKLNIMITKSISTNRKVDENPAYRKAIQELIAAKKLPGIVKLRQSKYLNNMVEQDH